MKIKMDQNGSAMMELLFLVPLLLIILALIWISGEFVYVKQRTLLAAKCLALHERDSWYDHLHAKEEARQDNKAYEGYSYEGESVLNPIFFPEEEATYRVIRYDAKMGLDESGKDYMPEAEERAGPRDPSFNDSGWNMLMQGVQSTRGATDSRVTIDYKPVAFWPDNAVTLADTVYLAAADWRYDELPGGYLGYLINIFTEGPKGEENSSSVSKGANRFLHYLFD